MKCAKTGVPIEVGDQVHSERFGDCTVTRLETKYAWLGEYVVYQNAQGEGAATYVNGMKDRVSLKKKKS